MNVNVLWGTAGSAERLWADAVKERCSTILARMCLCCGVHLARLSAYRQMLLRSVAVPSLHDCQCAVYFDWQG
eukprot:1156146-Pelagomonas_calceolata.AAC.4